MKITKEENKKVTCIHLTMDGLNTHFIECIDDGDWYSAWLCNKTWPRLKDLIFYRHSNKCSFDQFIADCEDTIVEAHIKFILDKNRKKYHAATTKIS